MFSTIPISEDWNFEGKTQKDTTYITHGYYTYPAKFIPQLVEKLLLKYSKPEDCVGDPFMGSGTTLVEALVNKRKAYGTDVNEVAVLLAKVKTTPIEYKKLLQYYYELIEKLYYTNIDKQLPQVEKIKIHERIDYWFPEKNKKHLLVILKNILEIQETDVRDFFLIAFAQILKSCSYWHPKSIKPTRKLDKKIANPVSRFKQQTEKMLHKHKEFNEMLPEKVKHNIDTYRKIYNADARDLPWETESIDLIITSPPYVTSYEYADLHQLPALWFGYLEELSEFRKKFIGSSRRDREKVNMCSSLAENIVRKLGNTKKAREVATYYSDMFESFKEMKRVLRSKGKVAIVIGNTRIKGVDILNAEVFAEQLQNLGFRILEVIHRKIPSKMLPSTRDPKTGRFIASNNSSKVLAYPSEFIVVGEKK